MDRVEQLRVMTEQISMLKPGSPELEEVIHHTMQSGITQAMHVGEHHMFFMMDRNTRVSEWLMGQYVDGHVRGDYTAYPNCIILSRTFLGGGR